MSRIKYYVCNDEYSPVVSGYDNVIGEYDNLDKAAYEATLAAETCATVHVFGTGAETGWYNEDRWISVYGKPWRPMVGWERYAKKSKRGRGKK